MDDSVTSNELASKRLERAETMRVAQEFAAAAEELECALHLEGPLELPIHAEIRLRLAKIRHDQGSPEGAREALQPLLDGPEPWRSRANFFWATSLLGKTQHDSVETLCKSVIPIFEEHGLTLDLAMAHFVYGSAQMQRGIPDEAATAYRKALVLVEDLKDWLRVARYRGQLGILHTKLGEYRAATEILGKSLHYFVKTGHSQDIAKTQLSLAVCWLRLGEADRCEMSLQEADRMNRQLKRPRGYVDVGNVRALLHLQQGRLDEATRDFRNSIETAQTIDYERGEHQAQLGVAECQWQIGDFETARRLTLETVRHWKNEAEIGDINTDALRLLGRTEGALGRNDAARQLLTKALSAAETSIAPRLAALCRVDLARTLALDGDRQGARELLCDAWISLRSLSLPYDVEYACSVATELEISLASPHAAILPAGISEHELIAVDPSSREVLEVAHRLAAYPNSVLLHGEPGCGKATLARFIHEVRADANGGVPDFVECSTADARDKLVELKPGSTVFLRSLHLLPEDQQAALLGTLAGLDAEERGIRILCSAEGDAQYLIALGLPGELGYRLASYELRLPPLRERPEDIDAMAREFADGSISEDALSELHIHDWPGNIRELKNGIRAARFHAGEDEIQPDHLPASIRPAVPLTLQDRVAEVEREAIGRALRYTDGNKKAAAEILGVSRKGLSDRIRRLQL